MKTLGLALGAGGSRGLAHVGFLQALEDNGIKPDFIAGTSIGAVIGAFYCFGYTPKYMLNTALALKPLDILDLSPLAVKNGTLLTSKKMSAVLNKYLKNSQIEYLNLPFACVGLDIVSGKKVIFDQGNTALAVQASSSIPMIFAPVEYENMLIADGGPVARVPVEEVKNLGADIVVAVDVSGNLKEMDELKSILGYLLRVCDIYDSKVNAYNLKEHKPDILCVPELEDMNKYKINPKELKFAYDKGYESALAIIDDLKRKLS